MMDGVESSELEDLCSYFNTKISNIKKYLQLRKIGKDQRLKSILQKTAKDMMVLHDLLNSMETEVKQQEKLKNLLEELQKAAERDKNEAQHLSEHVPTYLPKLTQPWNLTEIKHKFNVSKALCIPGVYREQFLIMPKPDFVNKRQFFLFMVQVMLNYVCTTSLQQYKDKALAGNMKEKQHLVMRNLVESIVVPTVKHEVQTKVEPEPELVKKPAKEKKVIKEIALLTAEEFADVPVYLKGRLTYDQINAVVRELNKAVMSKYKIMHQPLKFMSFAVRNLYQRFMEDETKDTKGQFFFVEADIKEFTLLKVDKRLHGILSILRHCRKVREVRGCRIVRYVIC